MAKNKKTVVVGLSGGVDSAVAALLLKKQGYNVIGAFMKNFSETKNKITGECLWVAEKKHAKKIASLLEIPLATFDFETEYKKFVINPMFRAYSRGLTPNPDVLCNKEIKFPMFWKEAGKLSADFIAMGHYIRLKRGRSGKGYELHRAKDKNKDQSYFLYELTQKDLQHALFPIGKYTKKQVRDIAKKHKFPNYNKKGTRGICFVGKINLKSFLKQKIKPNPGKIKNPEGKTIGKHDGITFYTMGERIRDHAGISIDKEFRDKHKSKLYVVDKNTEKNVLVAAPESHPSSFRKEFFIINLNLINKNEKLSRKNLKVRMRHLGEMIPCKITLSKNKHRCSLTKPITGIAEGQNAVIYEKTRVVGGGEIRMK